METQNENIVERSRDFAIKAHGTQTYGEHPYVVHLDSVHIAKRWGDCGGSGISS